MEELDGELKANFNQLGAMFEQIKGIVESVKLGTSLDEENLRTKVSEYEDAIVKVCTEEFLGADKPENIVIALTQLGLARDLIRVVEGLLSLEGKKDEKLFGEVTGLFFDAYSAFEKRDISASEIIKKKHENFLSEWNEKSLEMGYAKVATNGFYISRILGKPVSDLSIFKMDKDQL